MSNITRINFIQQMQQFPGTGMTPSVDLKSAVIGTWISLENEENLINGKSLFQVVQGAIQDQIKKTQGGASSELNTLHFGPTNTIAYVGAFTPPKAATPTSGPVDGRVNITLTVPGNTLSFTVFQSSNPTFEVDFTLVVRIQLTFPAGLSATWASVPTISAEVDALKVSTNNVGVSVCDPGAVKTVLDSINHQIVQIPAPSLSQLTTLDTDMQGLFLMGWTSLLESDDGAGDLVLTAVSFNLNVNGGLNDHIVLNTTAAGLLQVTAQGQTSTFQGIVNKVTVVSGGGTGTVHVVSLPIETTVSVQIPQGNHTITVGGSGLKKLTRTTINVAGGSGAATLIVDDTGDVTAQAATVTNSAVTFPGLLLTVNYSGNINKLQVIGGSAADEFFIPSTSAGTATVVDGGGGANSVYVGVTGTIVGKGFGEVAPIAGPLDVIDAKGPTALIIDASHPAFAGYQVYSDHVAFTNGPIINYQPGAFLAAHPPFLEVNSGITALTIYGSTSGNDILIESVGSSTKVILWESTKDVFGGPAATSVTRDFYLALGPVPMVPKAAGAP